MVIFQPYRKYIQKEVSNVVADLSIRDICAILGLAFKIYVYIKSKPPGNGKRPTEAPDSPANTPQ